MAIQEVTQWATTTVDNLGHHPTGPQGRNAVRISTSFRELQAAIARYRETASIVDLTVTGDVVMSNLPTSDPTVAGQLWSNAGVVTVSAG